MCLYFYGNSLSNCCQWNLQPNLHANMYLDTDTGIYVCTGAIISPGVKRFPWLTLHRVHVTRVQCQLQITAWLHIYVLSMLQSLTTAGAEKLSLFKLTNVPIKEFYFNQLPEVILYLNSCKEKDCPDLPSKS